MIDLIDLLIKHEGYEPHPYRDSQGYLTVGIGYNLDAGMPMSDAILLARAKLARAEDAAEQFLWYRSLTEGRKNVVLSMIYNLGIRGFKEFKKMIACMEKGDYELAASEMLDSLWRRQVGKRALELAQMMKDG